VADLEGFDVVMIDGAADGLPFSADDIARLRRDTRLVVVNPDETLQGNVPLDRHPDIETYWANRSFENDRALLSYLRRNVAEMDGGKDAPAPVVYPQSGFYHPDAGALFDTMDEYLDWYAARTDGHAYDAQAPSVGISSYIVYYRQENTALLDAQIAEIESQGANAITQLRDGAIDLSPFVCDGAPLVDVQLNDSERLNTQDLEAGIAELRRLGVPVLRAVPYPKGSAADYRASPGGMAPELTARVVDPEREGQIEPMVVGATNPEADIREYVVMPEQVRWRIQRALSWARLSRLDNADKRILFTFWSEAGGKSDIGGDPDDFLDVPGTLADLIGRMQAEGYDLGGGPLPDAKQIADKMARDASNVGAWAPGELARRVRGGDVFLLPEAEYREWYDALPEQRRAEIEEYWGPPPGDVMTAAMEDGTRAIVIPKIQLGNVLIAPHPMWGYLEDEKALMSKDALPPHHQYLAFFLYMQKEWKADAWVSLFSNIVLQPGKNEGPLADDHIGVLLGGLPHIHPERLGGNGGVSNRRKGMALAYGWYNIVTPSDAGEAIGDLRGVLGRYAAATQEQKRSFEATIREEAEESGLSRALDLDIRTAPLPELTAALETYIAELEASNMPWGGKLLGSAPEDGAMAAMVEGMLGRDFQSLFEERPDIGRAGARELIAMVVEQGRSPQAAAATVAGDPVPGLQEGLALAADFAARLRTAPREVDSLFAALSGAWLEPGPMGEPFRNPDTLPPGRTLYNLDPARLPTPEAEDIGARQAEALIDAYRAENDGAYPDKLAVVLFSADIAKTAGVSEGQILRLLGTRVERNWRGEVIGVSLIPREELGRPRVDVLVTTSGTYRDHYQDKVDLITQATALAAASPEDDNPVAKNIEDAVEALKEEGHGDADARLLAAARVFSPAPGAYSPSIQFLAKSGERRGDEARMAELFTRRMSHAYGGGLYGEYSQGAFKSGVAEMDAAMLPRTSDVNGMLDQPMSAAFLGGLNLAHKDITGEDADLFVSKLADLSNPQIETAARAIQTELRTRYFNPKWLQENQAHGYDGARNFMFLTDHLDLWDSTATETVSSDDWAEVKSVFVDDKFELGMDAFFDQANPFAHQMLMTNLLGAAQRGQWEATAEELAQIAARLAQSVAEHGPACEANQCANPAMTEFVETALSSLPDAAPLMAGYASAISAATGGGGGGSAGPAPDPTVTGRVVEEVLTAAAEDLGQSRMILIVLVIAGLGVAGLGWFRGGPV